MFGSMMYNHLSESEAIRRFRLVFGSRGFLDVGYLNTHFINGCFGSYGTSYTSNGSDPDKQFYFILASKTDRLDQAIEFFNESFENIKIRLVDRTNNITVSTGGWGGSKEMSEEGYADSPVKYQIAQRYRTNLLTIEFSKEYNPLTKYVLTIPIGFFIRMFCTYYGCLDSTNDFGDDYIQAALDFSNDHPGDNGGYISDYPFVRRDTFMEMDNIILMNKLFSKVIYDAPFKGSELEIDFGNSIKPFSVYAIIDRHFKRELEYPIDEDL